MAEDFKLLLGAEIRPEAVQNALKKIPDSAKTIELKVKGDNTFLKSVVNDGNKAVTTIERINNKTGETSVVFARTKESADKMGTSIATASKHTATLGSKFLDVSKKVIAFGAVTSLIGGFTSAMYKAVEVVKEFDKAQTEFTKVSDLSGDSLDDYTKKLGELGGTVARTRTEMIQASSEFVKSGYTEEQSAQLAKVASLYQNVADSQIDAGTASSFIISQLKAFNMTADDATTVIDMLNEVSNRFSVSSTDIASGMTKSSSALATYGNTMSESMGLITAG